MDEVNMLIRPLNAELQKKAEDELNEIPSRVSEDLEHIQQWVQKQPHLKLRAENQWLLTFLRGCKSSLQRTKEKLDYFYTMRTLLPEFFANRDPFLPEIQELLKIGYILPLPKTADAASSRMMLCRWGACNPDKVTYVTLVKVYFMCLDILMNEDDNCVVAGVRLITDLKGFSGNFLLQCTPSIMKKSILCVESAYPIRIKQVECINAPPVFDLLFNISKPFLTEKLKSRLNISTEENFPKIVNKISQPLFPREYGGDNSSVEELTDTWKKKIESYREWFLEDAKFRTYEDLRLGKPKTSSDVFGIEGTFRKLAVD